MRALVYARVCVALLAYMAFAAAQEGCLAQTAVLQPQSTSKVPLEPSSSALRLALGDQRFAANMDQPIALHELDASEPIVALSLRQSMRPMFPSNAEAQALGFTMPPRPVEFSVAARTVIPEVQVGYAQRAGASDRDEDSIRVLGREFRLGDLGVGEFKTPTWDNPQWYFFAADDDGAMTWTPAARRENTEAFRVQEDRVTIGDFQAGVSIEANGMQASLSYIKREVGNGQRSEDASFTGLSLTWRR